MTVSEEAGPSCDTERIQVLVFAWSCLSWLFTLMPEAIIGMDVVIRFILLRRWLRPYQLNSE